MIELDDTTSLDEPIDLSPAAFARGTTLAKDSLEAQLASLNRALPHSAEAECGILSCILQNPDHLAECRITLPPDSFYHPPYRLLYEQLLAMLDDGTPIDILTVTQRLRDRGLLEKCGGPAAVSEIFTTIPATSHFRHYSRTIRDKHLMRRLCAVCADGVTRAQEHGADETDVDTIVAATQEAVIDLSRARDSDGFLTWDQISGAVVDEIESAFDSPGKIPLSRVPTGFTSFDRRTGGLEGGHLIIVAGRPSMGKTSFAMNIVEHVVTAEGDYREYQHPRIPTLVFSLEMSGQSLGRRMLVGGAGVNLQQVKFGLGSKTNGMNRGDHDRISDRMKFLHRAPLYVVEKPGISIQEMRSRSRVMQQRYGIGLIVVDYLQLMCSDTRQARGNRSVEIGQISNGLKNMAKELKVPVIALAQLSRKAEERRGAVPQMADLREGGDIEQAADIIGFLHRPWYYNHDHPNPAEARLIIAKGRDIGVGEVPLEFIDNITQFNSLTSSLLSNDPEQRDAGYQSKPQPSRKNKSATSDTFQKGEFED